jgi:muramoyltetrapeptide carboxypeptidase
MNQLMTLKKCTTIGIAAPSSPFKKSDFEKAKSFIEGLDFKTKYSNAIFKEDGFVSGSAEHRSTDLAKLIKNNSVPAIFFVRGGYGAAQILPFLDKQNLSKHIKNKIIAGYSDITAIHCWVYKKYKQVVFYCPNITSRHFSKKIMNYFTKPSEIKIKLKRLEGKNKKDKIKAPIFGGCLSVLTSLVGTPYFPKLDGHILFIEDTNEPPYKIDRMLTQLLLSGQINKIKAIVVGSMENCDKKPYSWKEAVRRICRRLNIPGFFGLSAGHAQFKTVIPFGAKTLLDLASDELRIYSPFKENNK